MKGRRRGPGSFEKRFETACYFCWDLIFWTIATGAGHLRSLLNSEGSGLYNWTWILHTLFSYPYPFVPLRWLRWLRT